MPLSAAIDAGASIISNLFSKHSNDSANRNNMRIAQMNNEWSEKMMQKQMDYNSQQWEREAAYNDRVRAETNEYNSYKNQVERIKEGGGNPALLLNGSNVGTAQGGSAPSGNSVGLPSPSSASYSPMKYDFSGVGNAISTSLQLSMMQDRTAAEVNNLNAQADVARARAAADNAWTYEKLKETRIGRLFLEQTFDVRKNQLNADYANTLRSGRQMEENIKLTISQGLLAQKELAIFDAERSAGIANVIADTMLKGAMKGLTEQQMKHEVEKIYETAARAQGIRLANNQAARMSHAIVVKAYNDAKRSSEPQNIWQGLSDFKQGVDKFIEKEIVKPTKRAWKDTRRAFGI